MRKLGKWLALGAVSLACAVAGAQEWPKWMGPNGNGISTETGLLDKWPDGGPKKLWSANVGEGFASPIALNGKVYLFAMKGRNDVLTALDAETGKQLWSQSYEVKRKADQPQARNDENGLPVPDATPTIDGDRIYTYGGAGDLVCRQLQDGKLLWTTNILDQTGGRILAWNQASSPLLTDKLVYVQGGRGGATAVAVDKNSGKIAWKSQATEDGGYAAPVLIDIGGTKQLIIFAGKTLFAMNPHDGKTIWSLPWKTSYEVNASTPIFHDGKLFVSSGYGYGCAMLTPSPTGVKEDWHNKEVACKYQPALLDGDRLYANSAGRLKCLQWPTPKVLWKNNAVDLGEGGSIVLAGNKMIAMSETGKLSLLQIKPDGAEVVSETDLFNYDKVWSTPLIYHGKLYAKGKDQLLCLQISGK